MVAKFNYLTIIREGSDNYLICPELIRNNLYWWAPRLALLFTSIDMYYCTSRDWRPTIIDFIFKIREKRDLNKCLLKSAILTREVVGKIILAL